MGFEALFVAAADWFAGATVVEGAAALAATEVMAPIVVTASAGTAAGLTVGEMAALGLAGTGAAAASGFFGDGGTAGAYGDTGYDQYGLPLSGSWGQEFPMPISDAQVAQMTQQQGAALGLQDAGFTWKDGVGWARNALGMANLAAGLYGTIQNGKYRAAAANAAANSSRLSAEDAARRSAQMETFGLDASKKMQPWDENGGRALAGQQLQDLMTNPQGVANNDPAYKFRQQAAARAMGIYGQDSGAMGIAAADASSTWYDQRLQQLSGLAGANAAPGAGGALGLNTLNSAANIASMGQASGAFGDQAALAVKNANTQNNIATLNAASNLANGVGNMLTPSYTSPTFAPASGTIDTTAKFGGSGSTTDTFIGGSGETGNMVSPGVAPITPVSKPTGLASTGGAYSVPTNATGGPLLVSPAAGTSFANMQENEGNSWVGTNPVGFDQIPAGQSNSNTPSGPVWSMANIGQTLNPNDATRNMSQVQMSQLGNYTSRLPGGASSGYSPLQGPDMWQGQMGDLLGNYLGRGTQRMGA